MNMLDDLVTVELQPNIEACKVVIRDIAKGELPQEVLDSISGYALGNFGAARVLTEQSLVRNIKSHTELEALIGYPLWSASRKKAEQLWDRFKDDNR